MGKEITIVDKSLPASIARAMHQEQLIACHVAVLLGVGLASAVLLYLLYNGQGGASSEIAAAGRAARIAALVREAEASRSPTELDRVLKAERRRDLEVEQIPTERLASAPNVVSRNPAFVRSIKATLEDICGVPSPIIAIGWQLAALTADQGASFLKIMDWVVDKVREAPAAAA